VELSDISILFANPLPGAGREIISFSRVRSSGINGETHLFYIFFAHIE